MISLLPSINATRLRSPQCSWSGYLLIRYERIEARGI
jgi:hypothetical protein